MTNEEIPTWEYLSKSSGLGGTIKESVEDFKVEEIADHDINGGDHLILKLTKYNMTTLEAIREISNVLHISRKRFGYAGNKDKKAITTQYISIKGLDEEPENLFIPDLEIEILGKDGHIAVGQLEGNKFEVSIRNIAFPEDDIEGRIEKMSGELDGTIPNYFGRQRFGSVRPITHQVGREILKKNFGKAVWTYIAKPYEEEHKKIRKVREKLWESRDPSQAAEKFPEQYRYEKTLLYHLSKNPKNYIGALQRLPDGLQRLFIHAYQSYVFNRALSSLISDGFHDEDYELPLIGYKTPIKEEKPYEKIMEVLEEDEIEQKDFKLKSMPNLRSEGSYRKCFAPVKNFEISEVKEDDLNMNKNMVTLKFQLDKGCYATSLLREFMKND